MPLIDWDAVHRAEPSVLSAYAQAGVPLTSSQIAVLCRLDLTTAFLASQSLRLKDYLVFSFGRFPTAELRYQVAKVSHRR